MMTFLSALPVESVPLPSPALLPAQATPAGGISFHAPESPAALPYYLFRPTSLRPDRRPLVAVHGISRNAYEHVRTFAPLAERTGRLVVAPYFGPAQCKRYQRILDETCRSDEALLATLETLAARTGRAIAEVDIFGFSGGAQFAHRFGMLHPERVGRLALASAGWYTFPTVEDVFPYGIAEVDEEGWRIAASFGRFLRIPALVLVGEQDTQRDENLRKGRRVDPRQGATRVERGRRWTEAIRRAARERGILARTELQLLPGCGHSFADCVARAGLAERVVEWFDRSD